MDCLLYVLSFELRCFITVPQSRGREGVCLLPLGQIPLSQFLRSPVYLANTFTASLSLPYYGTKLRHRTMIPAGFLTIPACSCSDDQTFEW